MSVLAVAAFAGVAATPAAAKAPGRWHACHVRADDQGRVFLAELCAGRRVIFGYYDSLYETSGYRAIVTGWRRTGQKTGIVDVRGDWYIFGSDPTACNYGSPPPADCKEYVGVVRARFATADGGRSWSPLRAHRHLELISPPIDPVTGRWTVVRALDFDEPPLPCDPAYADHHEAHEGTKSGYGNVCWPSEFWNASDIFAETLSPRCILTCRANWSRGRARRVGS